MSRRGLVATMKDSRNRWRGRRKDSAAVLGWELFVATKVQRKGTPYSAGKRVAAWQQETEDERKAAYFMEMRVDGKRRGGENGREEPYKYKYSYSILDHLPPHLR